MATKRARRSCRARVILQYRKTGIALYVQLKVNISIIRILPMSDSSVAKI